MIPGLRSESSGLPTFGASRDKDVGNRFGVSMTAQSGALANRPFTEEEEK